MSLSFKIAGACLAPLLTAQQEFAVCYVMSDTPCAVEDALLCPWGSLGLFSRLLHAGIPESRGFAPEEGSCSSRSSFSPPPSWQMMAHFPHSAKAVKTKSSEEWKHPRGTQHHAPGKQCHCCYPTLRAQGVWGSNKISGAECRAWRHFVSAPLSELVAEEHSSDYLSPFRWQDCCPLLAAPATSHCPQWGIVPAHH